MHSTNAGGTADIFKFPFIIQHILDELLHGKLHATFYGLLPWNSYGTYQVLRICSRSQKTPPITNTIKSSSSHGHLPVFPVLGQSLVLSTSLFYSVFSPNVSSLHLLLSTHISNTELRVPPCPTSYSHLLTRLSNSSQCPQIGLPPCSLSKIKTTSHRSSSLKILQRFPLTYQWFSTFQTQHFLYFSNNKYSVTSLL